MSLMRGMCFTALTGAVLLQHVLTKEDEKKYRSKYSRNIPITWMPESREKTLFHAQTHKFDLVIIGGGSVGGGCLLDASTRGYSVLLLEKEDFSSGTSSKSTKLIHGGIRYLEKAIKELDYKQLSLVVEGLRERKSFLSIAPYLTREVGILLPIKHRVTVPYFWLGTKLYDWLSGRLGIQKSYFISKEKVRKLLPAINYKKLAGGMVYFDGQMDDSRVNTMLIETGLYYGGAALNYAEVTDFKKNKNGKITGVHFQDKKTGHMHTVDCTGVINATGPFSDAIRQKDDQTRRKIIAPSTGVHLVMSGGYTGHFGLLNPSTRNGSVLFVIPWKGLSIAGTTDTLTKSLHTPVPTERDVMYIVKEMGEFMEGKIAPKARNILSAWGGIRPLTLDGDSSKKSTSIVRSHLLDKSKSGLITISGGKWTSFREMAEETITGAAKIFGLPEIQCSTRYVKLIGSHQYSRTLPSELEREFGISEDIAMHLASSYGDRARKVCIYANGTYNRIDPKHPYITAEIPYCIDHEHVHKISDYIGRRSMFAYFSVRDAHSAVPAISKEFAKWMKWSGKEKLLEEKDAYNYLDTMGYSLLRLMEEKEIKFDQFKRNLLNICNNSICDYARVKYLTKKTFGETDQISFGHHRLEKGSVRMYDVISAIKMHFNILQ